MVELSPYASAGYTLVKLEPHLHTLHSDGQDTIEAMFAACKSAGYEAVALTDHNTVSGLSEAASIAEALELIFVPGVELTTFRGHAVALGITRTPEWRDLDTRGMDALASEVHAAGGVLSVAHPAALGSPICSGCAWDWQVEPTSIDLWEVMNGARLSFEVPRELWQQMLQRGARLGPVGAGDVHSTAAARAPRPATFAYVRERTPSGILEALRARRVFASIGTRLDFWLEHVDGRIAMAGETAPGAGWIPRTAPEAKITRIECDDGRRAVVAELCDDHDGLEAVSAPIWTSTSH